MFHRLVRYSRSRLINAALARFASSVAALASADAAAAAATEALVGADSCDSCLVVAVCDRTMQTERAGFPRLSVGGLPGGNDRIAWRSKFCSGTAAAMDC
jgi:hypothetical protein